MQSMNRRALTGLAVAAALLPASVLGGAIFLMLCDAISRAALPAIRSTGGELPVGAITALVGAPLFIYLLRARAAGARTS